LDSLNTNNPENVSRVDNSKVSPRNIEILFTGNENPQESDIQKAELDIPDDGGKQEY